MKIDVGVARVARGCLKILWATRATMKSLRFLKGCLGLPGVARQSGQATPQKVYIKQGCPGCPGCLPLKGSLTGRATPGPRDLGVPRFPNTPTRALDAICELVFVTPRHTKAQTEADTPAHGLLNEEPEMNSTNPRARFWTEAELDLLRTSWAAGLSCSEIAAKLTHRSGNAVGGMAHRLGLPVRGPGMAPRSKPRTQTPRQPTTASRGTIIRDYVPARITLAGPIWSHPAQVSA